MRICPRATHQRGHHAILNHAQQPLERGRAQPVLNHDALGGQVAAQANLENLGRVLLRLARQTVLALRFRTIYTWFEYKRMMTDEQINKTVFYMNKKYPYTKTWQTVASLCDVR